MSSLYLRPKYNRLHDPNTKYSVWISFNDQYRVHHSINTHFTISKRNLRIKRNSSTVYRLPFTAFNWPEHILSWQSDLDREIALGFWGKQTPVTRPVKLSESLALLIKQRKRDLSYTTICIYKDTIAKFITFLTDVPVQSITSAHITAFRTYLRDNYTDQSGRKFMRTLRSYFNFLVNLQLIEKTPFNAQHQINALDPPPRPFTRPELIQLLQTLQRTNPTAFRACLFMVLTGFRPSEIRNLKASDIKLHSTTIDVLNIKEKRYDPFPIDRKISAFLQHQKTEDPPYLFKHWHQTSLSHIVRKTIDALHLDPALKLYGLRKTFARNIIQSTGNVQIAQELCRHKSIQTTLKHYSFFSTDEKRKALEHSRKTGTSKG